MDLYTYVDALENKIKEKNKRYSNSKHLATQLVMLREILNNMAL